MAHVLEALIGDAATLLRVSDRLPGSTMVNLPQNVSMIPLTDPVLKQLAGRPLNALSSVEVGEGEIPYFESIAQCIGAVLEQIVPHSVVVYAATESFGGPGQQGAAAWRDGKVIMPPTREQHAINAALRLLGISVGKHRDEFEAIGLDRHRDTEDWTR